MTMVKERLAQWAQLAKWASTQREVGPLDIARTAASLGVEPDLMRDYLKASGLSSYDAQPVAAARASTETLPPARGDVFGGAVQETPFVVSGHGAVEEFGYDYLAAVRDGASDISARRAFFENALRQAGAPESDFQAAARQALEHISRRHGIAMDSSY